MSDETTPPETDDTPDTATAELDSERMDLGVEIEEIGPCRKQIKVTVPAEEIDRFRDDTVGELSGSAEVPGFRVGHVPRKLLERRFKEEIDGQIKQQVLIQSMQQITEEHGIDPIDEPELELEGLELPEEGDFTYDFKVEVSPEFALPDYKGLTIDKPTGQVSEDDVDAYIEDMLEEFGELEVKDGAAEAGDHVTLSAVFHHGDKVLSKVDEFTAELRPTLRFTDAELSGFAELMAGASAGDTREATVTISSESERVEMRGEEVQAKFTVKQVKTLKKPELDQAFLDDINMDTEEDLRTEIKATLTRQIEYRQRQTTREQVLAKITESASWELPEKYVLKHVENALRREILEMQQAGFSRQDIQARENELRQNAVSTTRQALKEHFVLDRIAKEENIEASPQEIETEIAIMAMRRGENPRRVATRMQKNGMIENLEAQIRERNAVDFILAQAQFNEVDAEPEASKTDVEAVRVTVCGLGGVEAGAASEDESDEAATEDE